MAHPKDKLSLDNYQPLEKEGKYKELLDYSLGRDGKEARYWELWSLFSLGRYDEALEKGLSYGVYFKEGEWKGHYLIMIGRVYEWRYESDLALQYYNWAYQVRIEVGDMEFVGYTLNRIGAAYMDKGELDKAIEYFKQSIVIAEETGDEASKATVMFNMGSTLIGKGEMDEAKKYIEKHVEIKIKKGENLIGSNALLGFIYFSEGDFEKAVEYIEPLYKFDKESGNQELTARDLVYLIDVEIHRDRVKAKIYLDELEGIRKDEQSSRIDIILNLHQLST